MAHEHALWAQTTLGEVATVTMGQAPPSSTVSESAQGIPFIQGNGEFGFRYPEPAKFCAQPARVAEPGDILVSVRAPVGALNIARQKLGIGRGLAAIKVNNAWPEFLWYALQSSVTKLNRVAQGSTFHAVNRSDLEHLEIRLPSLPKQRKIAAIFSSVDETIEKTEAVIEQLQVVKKAMMRELLTRGLPGRHSNFQDTAAGKIPKEWTVRSLGEIASVERGRFAYRPRNEPRLYGGRYPFIQTGDVANSGGRIDTYTQSLSEDGLGVSRLFPAGTIVMTIAANIGDTALTTFEVAFPDSLVGIIPKDEVDERFLRSCSKREKASCRIWLPRALKRTSTFKCSGHFLCRCHP